MKLVLTFDVSRVHPDTRKIFKTYANNDINNNYDKVLNVMAICGISPSIQVIYEPNLDAAHKEQPHSD